jgi:carboxymethylenebutenolidase
MTPTRIELRTEDGLCPAYTFQPAGTQEVPGVLFFMDGIGIRPALFAMAERLASAGYYVLLPDAYYRAGPYEPMDAKTVFADPAKRAELTSRFMPIATIANLMRDTRVFLEHFTQQPRVSSPNVGTTGYCLGGRLSLSAAGHYPDRIVAAAAFHPGNLANDAPDSPHLLAPKIKAHVYVAGATDDPSFPDQQKERLRKALAEAGVQHVIETYPARHGWVPTDTPAHDPVQAERHWKALLELLGRTLARA